MKGKLIFSNAIARHLIQKGHKVIDIKPHKENKDRTIFVFEVDENFEKDFLSCTSKGE